MAEKENIGVKWIHQTENKPNKCIRCGNTELRSDVVKVAFGSIDAAHAYCSKCETLMVYKK